MITPEPPPRPSPRLRRFAGDHGPRRDEDRADAADLLDAFASQLGDRDAFGGDPAREDDRSRSRRPDALAPRRPDNGDRPPQRLGAGALQPLPQRAAARTQERLAHHDATQLHPALLADR